MEDYSENALSIYSRLYYNNNEHSPEDVHHRVAAAIADSTDQEIAFYKLLQSKRFRPNTPCLINANLKNNIEDPYNNNLAACFVLGLDDSMDSIIQMWTICAKVYAGGGGCGIPLSNLREKGADISTGGQASGPISYLKVIQAISDSVRSGGKTRRAANLTSFKYNHPDILEYIECKEHNDLSAINISILVSDEFMKAVDNKEFDKEYNLVSPTGKIIRLITVGEVWNKICNQAWKSGDPGLLFYNESNRRHAFPSKGEIIATNPCLPNWVPVLTPTGYKFFNNINNEIYINNKKYQTSDLIKTHDDARIYEVKLESGLTSYMTLTHKIAIKQNTYKPLEELNIGDTVLVDLSNILLNQDNKFNQNQIDQGVTDWINRKANNCVAKALSKGFSYQFGLIVGAILNQNINVDVKNQVVLKEYDCPSILNLLQLYLMQFGIYCEIKYNKLYILGIDNLINALNLANKKSCIKKLNLTQLKENKKQFKNKQKIVSIDYYCNDKVYDIQVPNINEFVTSNIIVHNCGEVTLPDYSMCNLGSLNLYQYLDNYNSFDFEQFKEDIHRAVTFLNNVIDKTSYPTDDFKNRMLAERPIGLGIMGLSWTLYKMNIPYGSDASLIFFEKICKTLTIEAFRWSIHIAKNNGHGIEIPEEDKHHFIKRLKYYGLNDEDIEEFKTYGIYNSTVTSIAPTGTISISADTSYAFEPEMALIWSKKLVDSDKTLYFTNKIFEEACNKHNITLTDELKEKISKNKGSCQGIDEIPENIQRVFVTAFDVGWKRKIKMQEVGQRWITLAISSTCNLPKESTIEDVESAYLLAWKSKLKGITVYRDGSIAEQPVNFGGSDKNIPDTVNIHINQDCKKIKRPMVRLGKTIEIKTPHGTLYVTGNIDEKGKLIEVFLNLGQQGHVTNILLNALGRVISKYLQFGLPLKDICDTLSNCGGLGFFAKITTDGKSQQVDSIVDAISKIIETHFNCIKDSDLKNVQSLIYTKDIECIGEKCPQCGEMTLVHSSGCRGGSCASCGYSSCQ